MAPKAQAAKKNDGPWAPKGGAVFNVPRSGPKTMLRIERRVVETINHMRKGSNIKMVMYSFDRQPVADALIRAHKRGVSVQVILHNHETPPAQRSMRRAFGTNRSKRSFVYQCTFGCRGGEVQHSKFILFDRVGKKKNPGAKNVVMLGSVNMKMNGAKNQYNDLYVRRSPSLFKTLSALFKQMKKDKRIKNPYWKRDVTKRIKLFAFPFRGAVKKDPILKVLRKTKCSTPKMPNGRTQVRVNMHSWTGKRGERIANQLRTLYSRGCDVKVQYGRAGKIVRVAFGKRTSRGYVPVRSNGMDTDEDLEIDLYSHMKLLTIAGNYRGKRNARVVVTGSSNYEDNGLTGDELIVELRFKKAHKQYMKNWNWMWTMRTRPVHYLPSFNNTNAPNAPNTLARRQGPSQDAIIADKYSYNSPEWRDQ